MSKNNKKNALISIFAIVAIVIWGLVACNKQNLDELKEIPKTNINGDIIYKKDIGLYFNMQKTFNWVGTKVPKDISVTLLDSKYDSVDYYFLVKFNNWFRKLKFENGIMAIDQKENLDCDNFAMLYKSLFGISNYKSDKENEPAVALLVVRQVNEYGGIPSNNGLHMLNLIMTNNGWFVFEPQTDTMTLLEEYPNQEHVVYMIL